MRRVAIEVLEERETLLGDGNEVSDEEAVGAGTGTEAGAEEGCGNDADRSKRRICGKTYCVFNYLATLSLITLKVCCYDYLEDLSDSRLI